MSTFYTIHFIIFPFSAAYVMWAIWNTDGGLIVLDVILSIVVGLIPITNVVVPLLLLGVGRQLGDKLNALLHRKIC